jgi:hypothetical protein
MSPMGNVCMMELEDLLSSFQEYQTITFFSQNPIIKTSALSSIISGFLSREKQVHFADFDLQYSSLISNNSSHYEKLSNKLFQLFRSEGSQTVDLFVSLLNSSNVEKGGIIVLDSINTLQVMLQPRASRMDFVKSNHEAAILITLVQEFASRYSKTLILGNSVRPRPRERGGSKLWHTTLSGGRMITIKSDVVLSATQSLGGLGLNDKIVLIVESVADKHNGVFRKGQTFSFSVNSFI